MPTQSKYTPKKQTPVERANTLWYEWLRYRQPFENLWRRANNQYMSKFEKPVKGRSQFYFDLTRSQVRTQAAQLGMNLMGEAPYQEFEPYGQEDITAVRISEAVVYWAMTNPGSGFWDEMLNTILGAFIYGFSVMKHTYEEFHKTFDLHGAKVEQPTFEGIYYSSRSPFRVVINPAAYNFAYGRVGGIFDTEPRMPVERLLELEEQGAIYGVKKNLDKLAYGWSDLMTQSGSSNDPAERDFQNRDAKNDGICYLREFWDEERNEHTIIGNHDVELFFDKSSLAGGIPYTCFSLQNIPWQVMSMGIPEQLKYSQEYINLLGSLNATERLRNALPPLFIQSGLGLKSKLIRVEPDDIIETATPPRDAVFELQRASHQPEYWADIDRAQIWAQKSTGLSLAAEGIESSRESTATASSIANSASQGFVRYMTMLFSRRMGQMAIHNLKTLYQFMNPRLMRISLSSELEPEYEFVTRDKFALNVIPKVRDRSHTESRFQEMQVLNAMTPLLMPLMTGQLDPKSGSIIQPEMNFKEWAQIMLKTAQVKGWQRAFTKPIEENNPFGMQQVFAQMQGQGALKGPQAQAVPQEQGMGAMLGLIQSQLNPASNNNPGSDMGKLGGGL